MLRAPTVLTRQWAAGGPYNGLWGHPAFWGGDGGYVYQVENQGFLRAFKYGVTAMACGSRAPLLGSGRGGAVAPDRCDSLWNYDGTARDALKVTRTDDNTKGVPVPAFPPLGHVAITISDPAISLPWYERLIGSSPVLDEDGPFRNIVFAFGGTLLGLHVFPGDVASRDSFEAQRLGLDHLAFHVANRAELEQWQVRLDELGIKHSEIVDAGYGSALSFRDPDNIALEFFALPA